MDDVLSHIDPKVRELLPLAPIDDAARAYAGSQLVTDGFTFAVARWNGEGWVFPLSSVPLTFTPTYYQPAGARS